MGRDGIFHIIDLPDKYVVLAGNDHFPMGKNPIEYILSVTMNEEEKLTMIEEIVCGTFDIYNYRNSHYFKKRYLEFYNYDNSNYRFVRLFQIKKNLPKHIYTLCNALNQFRKKHYHRLDEKDIHYWRGENKIDFPLCYSDIDHEFFVVQFLHL